MKLPERRFPSRARANGGRRVRVARCGCGYESEVNDATRPPLSDVAVEGKLVQRGWFVGKREILCPKCNVARPRPAPKGEDEAMVQVQAREELRPRPAAVEAMPVKAEPPREPTREDRRKIIDYLDGAYDAKAQRYLGEGSDKGAAEGLSVPRKWVEEIRGHFYGDHDRNEAEEIRKVNLTELYQRGQDLEAKALQLAGEVETYKLDVKRALA